MNFDTAPSGSAILPRQSLELQLRAYKLAAQLPIHHWDRSKAESTEDGNKGNHAEYHKES